MELRRYFPPVAAWVCLIAALPLLAQPAGVLSGRVTLEAGGDPVAGVSVVIPKLGRSTMTGADGAYRFNSLTSGVYEVLAHLHPLTDARRSVEIPSGGRAELDFTLRFAPVHQEITVTASGREQTSLETFQSVASLELTDLAPKSAASLGEVLDGETGIAKRSYGPGSSRPVIRGFDGDRVMVLQDGISTGTLSSQSGDHGEPVDVNTIDKVEVVRGPATLLYGTNAIGGVVNVITGHHQIHQHAHEGVRGSLSGTGGTNNTMGGGAGSVEYGVGKWLFSVSGGGLRSGDYHTPLGKVANSETETKDASGSAAHYGEHGFFNAGYGIYEGRYGVPVAPESGGHNGEDAGHEHEGPVDLKWRRQNLRISGGYQNLNSALERFTLQLNYSDWNHKELVNEQVGTEFFNKQFVYRGVFDQRVRRRLSGSFGFSGLRRSYRVRGEEQMTPPVTQDSFAGFGLEEISLERFRLQFGGRIETNRFAPEGLQHRSFTGFSGSVGLNAPLWRDGVFVAGYSHSYRSPAIEELYNYGPHHGNLAFEIGNPNLKRERGEGFEVAVRHQARRVHGEVNLFYYLLKDYVYLAPTGEFREGLIAADYSQADSRYMGAEGRLHVGFHPNLWLNFGFDSVDAQLRETRVPLPRIPPVRGRIGFEARYKGFALRPELVLANSQHQLYFNETRTAGYATVDIGASYTAASKHLLHTISLNVFNAGDRLYRNHVSLIKDFAPEIGRGLRVNYTIRFF